MELRKRDVRQLVVLPDKKAVALVKRKNVLIMFSILFVFQLLIGISSNLEYAANRHTTQALITSFCESRARRTKVDETYYDDLAAAFSDNPKIKKIINDRAAAVSTLVKESTIKCNS